MYNDNIIIIGNDHINTLGVIRMFGENGISSDLILISNNEISSVSKSKYIKNTYFCKDMNTAILVLISDLSNNNKKNFIIPTSDEAVMYLDKFYDKLIEKNFIVPNIQRKKNEINKYMNKFFQFDFFKKNNINVANTAIINPSELKYITKKIKYPLIIKPNVSALGNKNDIRICKNINELEEVIKNKVYLNYEKIIVQEFLKYRYELDISGFSYNGEVSIPGIIKKERIWPADRGSTTSGYVQPVYKEYEEICNDIKRIMSYLNYNGIFDIEIFITDKGYVFNEINFRNSAVGYAYTYAKAYICYYWYLSNSIKKFIPQPMVSKEYYFINEHGDLHNVLNRNISYKEFKNAKKRAKILLVKNKADPKPYKIMGILKILNKTKINVFLKISKKIIHKDYKEMLMFLDGKDYKERIRNSNYSVIEINLNNLKKICEDNEDEREFFKLFKSKKCKGIYMLDNSNEIIGRGFLKLKGANDRFTTIKHNNSYLISSIHINEKFRGKNYQCDLMSYLINYYVNDLENAKIYGVVYEYNIPSKKNFEKLGFKKIGNFTIIRFLKNTINKKII